MDDTSDRPADSGLQAQEQKKYKIKVTVTDRESGLTRPVSLEEAKTWNWGDAETWRMVGGWQITSFQQFLQVLYVKMQNGVTEVDVLEAPRFTMLSGG